MNKIAILAIVLLLLGFIVFSLRQVLVTNSTQDTTSVIPSIQPSLAPTKVVNYTAGFAVFTNGTFRIFTDSKYHNLSNDVFIQADNPNVVHVKKSGITWNDFFTTLPMGLTKTCLTTGTKQVFCTSSAGKLQFYLNGKENPDALDKVIAKGDQLLVSYGSPNEEEIQKQQKLIPIVK